MVSSCEDLKAAMEDITSKDFDVGYLQGSKVIRLRSKEDLLEVWGYINVPNSKTTLWCGLESEGASKAGGGSKRRCEPDSDDDMPVKSGKKSQQSGWRKEEVQDIVDTLCEKHGSNYTPMQLRIWGEMIDGGLHNDTDHPSKDHNVCKSRKEHSS